MTSPWARSGVTPGVGGNDPIGNGDGAVGGNTAESTRAPSRVQGWTGGHACLERLAAQPQHRRHGGPATLHAAHQLVLELRHRLKEVEKRRERQVSQRHDHLTVSLVGYTNAGKSTLMNALTGADVYVADRLFATLDTRTRAWNIPQLGRVLLSDTVGFIRDLPHNLVASFRSTLEEARHADLLLHVCRTVVN